MAITPCSICHRRFLGTAVTGYHSWYAEGERFSWKQKLCFPCAKEHFGTLMAWSVDQADPNATMPETCAGCGGELDGDSDMTWTTWYRGKARKDAVLVLCPACMSDARIVMVDGADRQANREPSGVGAGGAPLPNPEGFGSPDDLPW